MPLCQIHTTGIVWGKLKGFVCLALYNHQLLASPAFPVLLWILLMRQLLNSASWMESLFMCFVLYIPQFPEQAGPCMPKPQSFCPVFENIGRALKANQHSPKPHLLTPPPSEARGSLSLNYLSYLIKIHLLQRGKLIQRWTNRHLLYKWLFVDANSK